MRFTNLDLKVAFITPKEQMPNGLSRVFLGQVSLIDCLQHRSIPAVFLRLGGEQVDDNIWGDLVLERYFSPDTQEVEELQILSCEEQ